MIPRYQRILFWTLTGLILVSAGFTIHMRQQSRDRIAASNDAMPYIQPVDGQTESVMLYLANDANGSITSGMRDAALPQETSLRARALIERLITEYSLPNSGHPLKPGPAVEEVFLLKLPAANAGAAVLAGNTPQPQPTLPEGLLAVVNLRGAFADAHPSSILVENLTVQSIVGTLHANLPQVTEIRFLVDGVPRETLAGHADLLRTYTAADTSIQHTQPVETAEP